MLESEWEEVNRNPDAEGTSAAPAAGTQNAGRKRKHAKRKHDNNVQLAQLDPRCFVHNCEGRRMACSRWCEKHNHLWGKMWGEAVRAGMTTSLQSAASTPVGAQKVLDEYQRGVKNHAR